MRILYFYIVSFFSFLTCESQILTGYGLIYEDDPRYEGYVKGKVYKTNGETIEGLVLFPYTTGNIRFKSSENVDYQELSPQEVKAFTMEIDSFATITNFSPEIIGITVRHFYEKGFVKVLIDGPISLFKHYSLQGIRNSQIVRVESFLLARKEENFTRFLTVPTDKHNFLNTVTDYFKRDEELKAEIIRNQYTFIDLREIVKSYNESYDKTEQHPEWTNVVIFRQRKKQRLDSLKIMMNDTLEFHLGVSDLIKLKTYARINKVCLDNNNCVFFRADKEELQFIESSYSSKKPNATILYVSPLYALPIIKTINRKKEKLSN